MKTLVKLLTLPAMLVIWTVQFFFSLLNPINEREERTGENFNEWLNREN